MSTVSMIMVIVGVGMVVVIMGVVVVSMRVVMRMVVLVMAMTMVVLVLEWGDQLLLLFTLIWHSGRRGWTSNLTAVFFNLRIRMHSVLLKH